MGLSLAWGKLFEGIFDAKAWNCYSRDHPSFIVYYYLLSDLLCAVFLHYYVAKPNLILGSYNVHIRIFQKWNLIAKRQQSERKQ